MNIRIKNLYLEAVAFKNNIYRVGINYDNRTADVNLIMNKNTLSFIIKGFIDVLENDTTFYHENISNNDKINSFTINIFQDKFNVNEGMYIKIINIAINNKNEIFNESIMIGSDYIRYIDDLKLFYMNLEENN